MHSITSITSISLTSVSRTSPGIVNDWVSGDGSEVCRRLRPPVNIKAFLVEPGLHVNWLAALALALPTGRIILCISIKPMDKNGYEREYISTFAPRLTVIRKKEELMSGGVLCDR
jgi:hypothetical protein